MEKQTEGATMWVKSDGDGDDGDYGDDGDNDVNTRHSQSLLATDH